MKNSVMKSTLRFLRPIGRSLLRVDPERAFAPALKSGRSAEVAPKLWALSNGSTSIILPIILFFLFSSASAQQEKGESRDAEFYNNRGMVYRDKGQYDQAISDFNKALEINPRFVRAYNNRGIAYGKKGQYDQAISDYSKALGINPRFAYPYNNRGNAYWEIGQYDRAISDLNKALEINPSYAEAYNNRGMAYRDKGQYDQGISDFNKALEINPMFVQAYYNRGMAYGRKSQYDQAISDYNKALGINPRFAEAYNNRGIVHYYKGQYDQAISDYNKALEMNPRFAEAYNNRGMAYRHKGQYDQAISDYNKALEINPRFVEAYNNRGIVYYYKGQYDQSISDFNKALELDPRFAEAYNNRGSAYYLKREYDKSLEDIKKAQDLGYKIPPKFLDDLRKASGKEESQKARRPTPSTLEQEKLRRGADVESELRSIKITEDTSKAYSKATEEKSAVDAFLKFHNALYKDDISTVKTHLVKRDVEKFYSIFHNDKNVLIALRDLYPPELKVLGEKREGEEVIVSVVGEFKSDKPLRFVIEEGKMKPKYSVTKNGLITMAKEEGQWKVAGFSWRW